MNLWARFKKLTIWNKITFIATICSIIIFLAWLFSNRQKSISVTVKDSPKAIVQSAADSPGTVQIVADHFIVKNISKIPKPTIDFKPIFINQAKDSKYESIFNVNVSTPYPVKKLYVVVQASTLEDIDLAPPGPAVYIGGPKVRKSGYMSTSVQNASGNLRLRLVTTEPEKFKISYKID